MTLDDLWSFGIYNLRLSDDQLWGLTLRQYFLLIDRWKEDNELTDRRFGRICAVLVNVNRSKGKALTEEDFMPKEKKQDSQSMANTVKALNAMFGGRVVETCQK